MEVMDRNFSAPQEVTVLIASIEQRRRHDIKASGRRIGAVGPL
jgi:hypothetical protein